MNQEETMATLSPCPCGSKHLYKSVEVSAGGGHAPNYLPGLGSWLSSEKFFLVLCKDCGLTRFYARSHAMEKLGESKKWIRL